MEQYNVTGMSCAACSARVEKAVGALSNVQHCSVNLLTNSMNVEGNASSDEIIAAVVRAGYGASLKNSNDVKSEKVNDNIETNSIRNRLIVSIIFTIILMYFSMGHMMWGWPVPKKLMGNHIAMGLIQLLLAALVMVINQRFFINGFKGLIHRTPNMDTLVAMGSMASFGWSVYVLFAMTAAQLQGDLEKVNDLMMEFYFESAAMILTLITIGKLLEARAKGKTTNAIKNLMKLAPKTATIIVEGVEKIIPVEHVKIGDVFIVKPGESIPVDGVVVEGNSSVNESALTGESIPVDKTIGSNVTSATINKQGFLKCRTTRIGEDTTISQIIKMVSDASATKAPIAKIADKVSGFFVPLVIGIALVTMLVWLIIGKNVGFALARGISVLVISCPCALGLATPVAIMVGNGVGARKGILFKTAEALEETGKATIIALDKTGTITTGKPVVTDVITINGSTEDFLKVAVALEEKSDHPLAKTIVEKYSNMKGAVDITAFEELPGKGLLASYKGKEAVAGNYDFIKSKIELSEEIADKYKKISDIGKTSMFFALGGELLGIIAVADEIKKDSASAIKELAKMKIRTVMITGDNERTAEAIGTKAGIEEIIAGVLPGGKESAVKELKKSGKVIMVGDGINDAPALTTADVGIAIGAGSDIAIDAADVVLMNNSLMDVVTAIKLSKKTLINIKENLFWAFIYNIIGIPLAAGALRGIGISLNPMICSLAMSFSSFCVVSNALRLNKQGRILANGIESKTKGDKKMKKTLLIKGMMCGHCEATVKKALEAMEGVASAEVSHDAGTAVVTLTKEIETEEFKKVIEAKDFEFAGVK